MSRFKPLSRLLHAACSAISLVAVVLGLGSRAARAQSVPGENEIFVANRGNLEGQGQSITVYARTAIGNVAPLRTISGPNLGTPVGVAVDRVNNELVVLDETGPSHPYGSIYVYTLTADGDVAPLRTITGVAPGLRSPWGLALDTVHNEFIVANAEWTSGPSASLTVYDRTANGNVAPLRTITGANTGLSSRPAGPAVDTANDELFVANSSTNSIAVFARTANGNVAPLRTIAGPATGLNTPLGLTVDTMHNELVVANFGGSSINVYPRTANGNAAPLRTITFLDSPAAVAIDTVHDELAVAGFSYSPSIRVYSRGGGPTLRTISGPATGLFAPLALAITIACPPITLSPATLPNGTLGSAYTQTLTPVAGTGPYTFTVAGLPAGMTPTSQVGGSFVTIGGTPTAAFSGTVTVSGTDAVNCPFSQNYSLFISEAPTVASVTPNSGPASGGTPLTVTGSGFQGGATLTIGSAAAVNVSVVGAMHIDAASPVLTPGTLNDVVVVNPDLSSATLAEGFFADFLDVDQGHWSHRFVEKLVRNKITAGYGNGNYGPGDPLTRGQAAVFLLRSKEGSTYVPPACTAQVFDDVPCSAGFAPWINELWVRGGTGGCGGSNYCPREAATRGQMAVFLLRTKEGASYTPPACLIPTFADVPCTTSFYAPWVNEMARRGIAAGCGGGNYCPDSPVTRGQMAVFLVVTFSLP